MSTRKSVKSSATMPTLEQVVPIGLPLRARVSLTMVTAAADHHPRRDRLTTVDRRCAAAKRKKTK